MLQVLNILFLSFTVFAASGNEYPISLQAIQDAVDFSNKMHVEGNCAEDTNQNAQSISPRHTFLIDTFEKLQMAGLGTTHCLTLIISDQYNTSGFGQQIRMNTAQLDFLFDNYPEITARNLSILLLAHEISHYLRDEIYVKNQSNHLSPWGLDPAEINSRARAAKGDSAAKAYKDFGYSHSEIDILGLVLMQRAGFSLSGVNQFIPSIISYHSTIRKIEISGALRIEAALRDKLLSNFLTQIR